MVDDILQQPRWFYIGRQDEQIHGPYPSSDMMTWLKHNFFQPNGNLLLKLIEDNDFYPLDQWFRDCGAQNPFLLPGTSYQSMVTMQLNQMNMQQRVPVSECFSPISGTPSSTPTPAFGAPPDHHLQPQQQQSIMPTQLVRPSAGPGQPFLLMNSAATGNPALFQAPPPGVLRPAQPIFSPPTLPPISMVSVSNLPSNHPASIYHHPLVQQRASLPPFPPPPPFSLATTRFPPPSSVQIQPQQLANNGVSEQQQEMSTGASDSPDSGHVVTPYAQRDKSVDTADAPWNNRGSERMVDKAVGQDTPTGNHQTTQTQTEPYTISSAEAQKWISQLLGCRVVIG